VEEVSSENSESSVVSYMEDDSLVESSQKDDSSGIEFNNKGNKCFDKIFCKKLLFFCQISVLVLLG